MTTTRAVSMAKGERCLRLAKLAQKRFRVENSNDVEALELTDEAAKWFLIADEPGKARESYHKAAEACLRMGGTENAAAFYANAGKALELVSPLDACDDYARAVELCCDCKLWDLAGIFAFHCAQIYDRCNVDDRSSRYRAVADLLSGSQDPRKRGLRDYCRETAAKEDALAKKYNDAARAFQDLGLTAKETNLTRLNATRHFFRAGLCHIADEAFDVAKGKLRLFVDYDGLFLASIERRFLLDVLDCFLVKDDDTPPPAENDDSEDDDAEDILERSSSSSEDAHHDASTASIVQERDLPDRNRYVDRAYDLAAARRLDVFELTLLKRIHIIILDRINRYHRRREKAQRKAAKQQQKLIDEQQRQRRLARDAQPAARGN